MLEGDFVRIKAGVDHIPEDRARGSQLVHDLRWLLAEVARLRADVARLEKMADDYEVDHRMFVREHKRLRAALEQYGEHKPECGVNAPPEVNGGKCICGLGATKKEV